MNILISQNEAEPSWITKLLFVIRDYHLPGNHSNTKSRYWHKGSVMLPWYTFFKSDLCQPE